MVLSKHYFLLLLLSYSFQTFSQPNLQTTIESIGIIGLKQLNQGALLITTGRDNQSIVCAKLDFNANEVWQVLIEVPNLGGYNFNMLQVFEDEEFMFITQQLSDYTLITKILCSTGEIVYDNELVNVRGGEEPLVWAIADGEIYLINGDKGLVSTRKFSGEDKLKEENEVIAFAEQFSKNKARVFFSDSSSIYAGAYLLEPNHGIMHLTLSKYDIKSTASIEQEIELELENTSFTYNSQFDLNVFGVIKGNTGFYMVGKLDYHFDKPYPTTKMGDNHIGIWVAKFDFDLNLEFMRELPYQYFIGLVPADMVQRPAVVDIKEDANKGLFIAINELQGVIYGNKYFLYIDSTGMYRSVIGGKDGFNVLEYDKSGLRNAGKRNKIRLMNDHWSPYVTGTFLFNNNRPQDHSTLAENLITLRKQNKRFEPENWSYNFLTFKDKTLYFEYNERKSGTLNIYTN